MHPKISFITPTIARDSLTTACDSLLAQTYQNWEQIVVVDSIRQKRDWHNLVPQDARIHVVEYVRRTDGNDCGNSARHVGWCFASGDYLAYLDDDNYMYNDRALQQIVEQIDGEDVILFPIMFVGGYFPAETPPTVDHIDTGQIFHKKYIGGSPVQWMVEPGLSNDGIFISNCWSCAESKTALKGEPLIRHVGRNYG